MLKSATRIPLNRRIIITVSLVTTPVIIIESSLPVIHSTVLNTVPIRRRPLIRIRRRLMRIVMLSDWRRPNRIGRSAQILIRVRGNNRGSNRRRNSMKIPGLRRMIIDWVMYYGLSSVWVVDYLWCRCCWHEKLRLVYVVAAW